MAKFGIPPLIVVGAASLTGVWLLSGCSNTPTAPQGALPGVKTATAKPGTTANGGGIQARRVVKTAKDPDASKIDKSPKDTTIEDIVAQKGPADGKLAERVAPFETSEWRVDCTIKSVQTMKDGDYYLVMQGQKGGQTVVEVPDPKECKGSPLESEITEARKTLEARYHPTKEVKQLNDNATVTGVGFLGWGGAPKKTAKGRTGPRLMPGTHFDFGKKS